MRIDPKDKNRVVLFKSFISGMAWMIGATLGFTIFLSVLKFLGGLPIIGNFFASIIEATNQALEARGNLLQ